MPDVIIDGSISNQIGGGKPIGLFCIGLPPLTPHQKIIYVGEDERLKFGGAFYDKLHKRSNARGGPADIINDVVFEQLALYQKDSDFSEYFTIEPCAQNKIALRSSLNGKCVSVRLSDDKCLKAIKVGVPEAWETFELIRLEGEYDHFAIKLANTNYYVSANAGGYLEVVDANERVGEFEKFRIIWSHIDFKKAISAFARNSEFEDKVKYHTKHIVSPRPGRGVLFHKELIAFDNHMLWLYEAFPKFCDHPSYDREPWPNGWCYEHVWNGLIIEEDGYISASCTIPAVSSQDKWIPAIPRVRKHNLVGVKTTTKNTKPDTGYFGIIYIPRLVDLEGNIGKRWVVDLGYKDGPERWCVDLGRNPGVFNPQYGIVGYHEATNWSDERFFGNLRTYPIGAPPEPIGLLSVENWRDIPSSLMDSQSQLSSTDLCVEPSTPANEALTASSNTFELSQRLLHLIHNNQTLAVANLLKNPVLQDVTLLLKVKKSVSPNFTATRAAQLLEVKIQELECENAMHQRKVITRASSSSSSISVAYASIFSPARTDGEDDKKLLDAIRLNQNLVVKNLLKRDIFSVETLTKAKELAEQLNNLQALKAIQCVIEEYGVTTERTCSRQCLAR